MTTLSSCESFGFMHRRQIAVVRTGTSTLTGNNYHATDTQTVDRDNTTIKSIFPDPMGFGAGRFSV